MDLTLTEVPEAAIKDADRAVIRDLARSLSAEQALWVSGYFAGVAEARGDLSAAGREASTAISQAARAAQAPAAASLLRILYASESGNSAALARTIEERARGLGLCTGVEDLARYKTRALAEEETILFVASTHGEGDPPESAAPFFEFLSGPRAPSLQRLRFAVLALGDSTYEFFCEAGKRLDRRLEELGAVRLLDRCDCDVDYEAAAAAWVERLIARLVGDGAASAGAQAGTSAAVQAGVSVPPHAAAASMKGAAASVEVAAARYGRQRPFPAPVLASLRLTGRGSSKDTRHLELGLEGSGLDHLPGDALGVAARNDPALVSELIEHFGWSGAEPVAVGEGEVPIAQALAGELEITALTPRFVEWWAAACGDRQLAELGSAQSRAQLGAFMEGNQVIDLVRSRPARGVAPQAFAQALRRLQPRLYSIASSLALAPDEVHLCVAPVRYSLHGRDRHGVASVFLADRLEPGDSVPVYVQRNDHFRLPDDPAAPIVMIGAGTGVAPYRAFMQHREALGLGAKSWLFFGERNFRTDFLYQTEWQAWHREGLLTRIDLAFSRDGERKVYVQQRLLEQAASLFAWLEEGAHLYVCGDAGHMARDVHAALVEVVAAGRGRGREDAEEHLRELQAAGRYQRDVY